MARSDCPVHAAVKESREKHDTGAVLNKIGPVTPTCTCGPCWFCETARKIVHARGTPEWNDLWTKLWDPRRVESPE